MLQLASSVLFFSNSLYSFKSANVIINEAHGTAINGLSTNLQSKNQKYAVIIIQIFFFLIEIFVGKC